MARMLRHLVAALLLSFPSLGLLAEEPLTALSPLDRAVFQRDAQGMGAVPIACPWTGDAKAVLEARVVDRQTDAVVQDWAPVPTEAQGGRLQGRAALRAGWYRLELRVAVGAVRTPVAPVDHVGVGEVFVTCGQSNSANHGKPPQTATEDRVSAQDFQKGTWRHSVDPQPGASGGGGSPWPLLGDHLVRRLQVPVGFICIGVGSTPVAAWIPGGKCAARLKAAVQLAGPQGLRAVLWHQGESDAIAGTTAEEYAERLGTAIRRSREDAGWAIPWGVALASYVPNAKATPDRQEAVLAGQRQVIATVPGVFQGPATNDFHTRRMVADGVHFNGAGLAAHAAGWDTVLQAIIPSPVPRAP